ncbi:MAG: OmpA family protein [Rhodobacteraceae bacterium]|nr:OmpA family protein [Paracoccaceae bacterium]
MTRTALAAALALGLATPAAADCRFTLHFAFGSAALSRADAGLLHRVVRAYPGASFALSAHADDDGSPAGNARVAERRAEAVAGRLHRAGLRGTQVVAVSDAWDVTPSTGASSPLNRRVDLFVAGCDPSAHPEARLPWSPGVALHGGRVVLTRPLEPGR